MVTKQTVGIVILNLVIRKRELYKMFQVEAAKSVYTTNALKTKMMEYTSILTMRLKAVLSTLKRKIINKMSDIADKDFLSNQLIKLGDMMGDGLHNEPDGAWISREYKRICKILYPEMFPKKDTSKRNQSVALWSSSHKCQLCGGDLKQTRKGALRVVCVKCNQKFQLKHKNK